MGVFSNKPILQPTVTGVISVITATITTLVLAGTITGHILPTTDASYDVGSTAARWKNAFFSSSVRVAAVNTNRNEYVATTGTNSGDCTVITSPCLTINYAIQQAANSIHPGSVNIYVADGTYNENIIAYDMMGASSTPSTALTSLPYGNSRVNLIGNPTSPSSVIVQGASGFMGVFSSENLNTIYSLNGFTLQGVNGSSESAIYATGDKSNVFVNNINTTSTGRIMTLNYGATAYYDNGTGGGNHYVSARGFSVRQRATLYLNKGVNVTSTVTSANVMMEVMDGGAIITGTTSQTYRFVSLNCGSGGGFFQPNGAESIIRAFSTSDVVNVICVTGGTSVWRPISGARAQIIGNATFNVSSTATYTLADIDAISYLYSLSTPTWNVLGSTARTIRLYQGGMALDPSNFGGATVTYAEFDGDYQYGYDDRYLLQEAASSTTLNVGGTALPANTLFSVIGSGATSTIMCGSATKKCCIGFGDDDAGGVTYLTVRDGVATFSTTACNP